MIILYHFGGAICAQKVRIALAEKGVTWESRECAGPDLRNPDYLRLNPSGVVPTLLHDDLVLTESRIISEYIEEAFDGPALLSRVPQDRYRARKWTKQVDDSLHLNVFILTFAMIARDAFLAMPPEALETALPGLKDPVKRHLSEQLLQHGPDSPWVSGAVLRFQKMVDDLEAALSASPFLAGTDYSLADADYTPYLNRLVDLGLERLWSDKPALQDWWSRMQARPSFRTAITDWVSQGDAANYGKARERSVGLLA